MSFWFNLAIFVGLLSATAVFLEKHLPEAESGIYDPADLPEHLRQWKARGKMIEVHGHNVFTIVEGNHVSVVEGFLDFKSTGSGPETILLLHGFPASSYDYHRAIDHLSKEFKVVVFDFVGYGFSDKPNSTFVYSMADQAEMTLSIWSALGVKGGHVVAHDMGDSVATEIVARRDRRSLPDQFGGDFFKSFSFNNGGMFYEAIDMRFIQRVLKTPILGPFVTSLRSKLPHEWAQALILQQLRTIWSPTYEDVERRERDLQDLDTLTRWNNGYAISDKTISYLHDRARFEPRWLSALSRLDLPVMLLWGDSDAVAPMEIPKSLVSKGHVNAKHFTGKTMKGVGEEGKAKDEFHSIKLSFSGHFPMLERPQTWAETVIQFVKSTSSKQGKQ